MKNWLFNWSLMAKTFSEVSPVWIVWRFSIPQHCWAKGQLQKRCWAVSSSQVRQISQLYESRLFAAWVKALGDALTLTVQRQGERDGGTAVPALRYVSCRLPPLSNLICCRRSKPARSVEWLRPCLVPTKIQKVFKISRHIESCGTCMKH